MTLDELLASYDTYIALALIVIGFIVMHVISRRSEKNDSKHH